MRVIEGGGFRLLTADPVVIALVRRCDELLNENWRLRRMLRAKRKTPRSSVARRKGRLDA